MFRALLLIFLSTVGIFACIASTESQIEVHSQRILHNLRVENQEVPIGIDVVHPRFSWKIPIDGERRGQLQSFYKVVVTDEEGKTVWNTGKVASQTSVNLKYQGEALNPQTRYFWVVTVWDNFNALFTGRSYFETGLMNPTIDAWNGARWLGGSQEDLTFYSDYLPVFDIDVDIRITKGGNASLVFAANDPRLMSRYKNIYQLQNNENESYFKVELDVSPLVKNEPATLNVYRAGYTQNDNPTVPLYSRKIKLSVLNIDNMGAKHHLLVHSEFGTITVQLNHDESFWINDGAEESKLGSKIIKPLVKGASFQLNPLGSNHDYITYGMLAEFGFSVQSNSAAEFSNLQIRNIHKPKNLLFRETPSKGYQGIFAKYIGKGLIAGEGVYNISAADKPVFILSSPPSKGLVRLRSDFQLPQKNISKARLYATARGIYDFYINNQRVSNEYYNPGLTQYNKTQFYQTFDVTDILRQGDNAMGAVLSEGWWSGMLGFGNVWNGFGDRQSLLAQLIVNYEDGSEDIFITNPETWFYNTEGPIRYSSLTMGEVYDATREVTPAIWSSPTFSEHWEFAEVVPLDGSTSLDIQPNMMRSLLSLDYAEMKLIGQIGKPASEYTVVKAKSVSEVRPGVFIYDLGQNIVGVPSVQFDDGVKGNIVTLRFAEVLYPDLPESGMNVGLIMTENYRAALSQDIYIMKNGKQHFQPRFTSHGFRYIEITGIKKPLPLEAINGVVVSSIEQISAEYESSNKKVNKLWSNLVWSNIGNFLSIPTDCPQRNERMGWSGDINVFAPTATYVSDSSQFLRRHLLAMRDTQSEDGRFSDIAPVGGGFGGVLWGIAGITIPWELYLQYGDTGVLAEHYEAMNKYMDYLHDNIDPKTGLLTDGRLGDWLGLQNEQLGPAYLTSAYYVYALEIMQRVADIMGQQLDKQKFAAQHRERKVFFNQRYISDSLDILTSLKSVHPTTSFNQINTANTQTALAVGLGLNVFDNSFASIMGTKLSNIVATSNIDDEGVTWPPYSLMTGFIGTAWISKALSEQGNTADAYKLLLNDNYPSWLYPVTQGATTVWERLDGYTTENGFGGNNSMNSYNHYSYGAVGEWLIAYSGGIRRGVPGFKSFYLQPEIDPTGNITWVNSSYNSVYGYISSNWQIARDILSYQVTVPANTTATVELPIDITTLTERGKRVVEGNGILGIYSKNNMVRIELGSGRFSFQGLYNATVN